MHMSSILKTGAPRQGTQGTDPVSLLCKDLQIRLQVWHSMPNLRAHIGEDRGAGDQRDSASIQPACAPVVDVRAQQGQRPNGLHHSKAQRQQLLVEFELRTALHRKPQTRQAVQAYQACISVDSAVAAKRIQ